MRGACTTPCRCLPRKKQTSDALMYSAGVACYAICIHCLLLLGRFDAREGGRGGERETVSSSRVNPFVGIARLITKTRVAGNLRELCGRCFIEIPEISFSRFEYRGTLFVNWTTGVELTGVHPRIITFYFISRKGDLETLLLLIDKKRNRPV